MVKENFSLTHTNSLTSICELFKTLWVIIFWVRVSRKILNVNCIKNSLNNIIHHLSRLNKLSLTHTNPSYPFVNFQNPMSYYFWVRVTHKMLNVKLHKNLLNNFICHLSWLKKLSPHSYKFPPIHMWTFKTLRVIIFWVRVSHKMLNVNCIKIHSIILSVTCQGLINFPPFIQIPSYPFVNFRNPMGYTVSNQSCSTWIYLSYLGIKLQNA